MISENQKEQFYQILSSLASTVEYEDNPEGDFAFDINQLIAESADKDSFSENHISSLDSILENYSASVPEISPIKKNREQNSESAKLAQQSDKMSDKFNGSKPTPETVAAVSVDTGLSESVIYKKLYEESILEKNNEDTDGDGDADGSQLEKNREGEEENVVSDEDKEKQEKLLSALNKVNKNIEKINGLDSKEELKDIYLQEYGKKYLIERKLKDLGYEFEDVEKDVLDEIFESKRVDNKILVNVSESHRKFVSRTNLNENSGLFRRIVSNNVKDRLDEGLEVNIPSSGSTFIITSNPDLEDEVFLECDSEIPDSVSEGFKRLGKSTVIPKKDIQVVLSRIQDLSNNESKYYLAVDGMYVNISDDGDVDIVDEHEDAVSYDDENIALQEMKGLNETYNWGVTVKSKRDGKINPLARFSGDYFKLDENYSFKGKTIAKKGTVVSKLNESFIFKNVKGNEASIKNNSLFENNLIPISESEYQLHISNDVVNSNRGFKSLKESYAKEGYDLTYKKWVHGSTLFESFVAKKDGKDVILGDPKWSELNENEILDEIETSYSDIFAIDNYENDPEKTSDYLEMALDNGLENHDPEQMGENYENEEEVELVDNEEYKIKSDVYLNENGKVSTKNRFGSRQLFERNQVVRYSEGNGFTADNINFIEMNEGYLVKHEKFDLSELNEGANYKLSDLNESVNVSYNGSFTIDGVDLYEFKNSKNEELFLNEHDVTHNLSKI